MQKFYTESPQSFSECCCWK